MWTHGFPSPRTYGIDLMKSPKAPTEPVIANIVPNQLNPDTGDGDGITPKEAGPDEKISEAPFSLLVKPDSTE